MIKDNRRVRQVRLQEVIKRFFDHCHAWRVQILIAVNLAVTRRRQQAVGRRQIRLKHLRQMQNHALTGLASARFQKADVLRRYFAFQGEIHLAQPFTLPHFSKKRTEGAHGSSCEYSSVQRLSSSRVCCTITSQVIVPITAQVDAL